ncbi:MAG: FAD-dependent monooxygenase [Solirubrobacterales bacterium]|nr:FAD-dependent monooxygenase [Solirubrobacterales bacterium]
MNTANPSSATPRVLIVGAGIAGLATAGALARIGWEVDVVERRWTFNGTPTGLFIPANGVRALRALGLGDRVIARGRPIERLVARTADGTLGAGVDLERVWPAVGPCCAVQRDLALDALLETSRAPVRMGSGLSALESDGVAVRATLENGTSERYDLVVGADGVRSTVRDSCWPDAPAAYGGESWWRGVVQCPAELDAWTVSMCTAGNFLVIPLGNGKAYWVGGHSSPDPFRDPVQGRAARVRERFDDLQGAPRDVLDQITDDDRVQFSPAEQAWVEDPVADRVVLVGDAWHAATPSMAQGASLAFEDALVLAAELAAADQDGIDAALARYAQRRRPRTAHVQQATAVRNQLAALPLETRKQAINRWPEISIASFAPLVANP